MKRPPLLHLYAFICLCTLTQCKGMTPPFTIIQDGKSTYTILLPIKPLPVEQKAATILQQYIRQATGVLLPITKETTTQNAATQHYLSIGRTTAALHTLPLNDLPDEAFLLATHNENAFLAGRNGKSTLYAVYTFIEQYLHGRKYDASPPVIPTTTTLHLPGQLSEQQQPAFSYREVYYPYSNDPEYLDWHHLHRLDDDWGLWGHTFNKLLPPATYFATHPEYYALINEQRNADQLCLSNPAVKDIVIAALKERIQQNPGAHYWSVSPNDNENYCQCPQCTALNKAEGSIQGSLLTFVNSIAAAFPTKQITTLAYNSGSHPPLHLTPLPNVTILLSNINALRQKPLPQSPSAAPFRNDLQGWLQKTPRVFVWDYVTQYTNYLAPFPNWNTLQPNLSWMSATGVTGVFEQGSEGTESESSALRSYVLAKLLWNPQCAIDSLITDFLQGYYGKAAPYLQAYLNQLNEKSQQTKAILDIYGNPIADRKTFLSPTLIDTCSQLLDKAEAAVENNPLFSARVRTARLPLEYTVLQQSRYYGTDQYGYYQTTGNTYTIRPNWPKRVTRFITDCNTANIHLLNEAGTTPEQYLAEWQTIFKQGYTPTLAFQARVQANTPFSEDYPNKGPQTLTDGTPGFSDYSYNWLCYNGTNMDITIDLGKNTTLHTIFMHFLNDPRHYIFEPRTVEILCSEDGTTYKTTALQQHTPPQEQYTISTPQTTFRINTQARYIKVKATNLGTLPPWRINEKRKPMLACDEIYIQ